MLDPNDKALVGPIRHPACAKGDLPRKNGKTAVWVSFPHMEPGRNWLRDAFLGIDPGRGVSETIEQEFPAHG